MRKGILIIAGLCMIVGGINATERTAGAEGNLRDAASAGNLALVKSLITNNVDVNARDEKGETALMVAALGGHVEVAQALLTAKADVNARDKKGWTALLDASLKNNVEVVRLLMAARADVDAKTESGWKALTLASERGFNDVALLLVEPEMAAYGSQDANFYYQKGKEYRKAGDLQRAVVYEYKALQLDPGLTLAYWQRAFAYYLYETRKDECRFCKNVIEDCNKVLERYPKFANAYYLQGYSRSKLADYEQAIKDFDKAIEFNPRLAVAYYGRANAFRSFNKDDTYLYGTDMKIAAQLGDAQARELLADKGISWR